MFLTYKYLYSFPMGKSKNLSTVFSQGITYNVIVFNINVMYPYSYINHTSHEEVDQHEGDSHEEMDSDAQTIL